MAGKTEEDLSFLDSIPQTGGANQVAGSEDLSFLDNVPSAPAAGNIAPTTQELSPSNAPAKLGFDPNQIPTAQINAKPLTPSDLGDLRRTDTITTENSHPEMLSQLQDLRSFGTALTDAAVPLVREATTMASNPLNIKAALEAQRRQDAADAAVSPWNHAAGTAVGVVAGGLLGGLGSSAVAPMIEKAAAGPSVGVLSRIMSTAGKTLGPESEVQMGKYLTSQMYKDIPEQVAKIAAMGLEGGASSVALDKPEKFEDYVHSFITGSSIAAGLGAVAEGAQGMFKNSMIGPLSETSMSKRAAQLGYNEGRVVLNEGNRISSRLASLPDHVDSILASHIEELSNQKKAIIGNLKGVKLDVSDVYAPAYTQLDRLNKLAATAEAKSTIAAARQQLRMMEQQGATSFEKTVPKTTFDPMLGKQEGTEKIVRTLSDKADVTKVDTAVDQLQDMIYKDQTWKRNSPPGLRNLMKQVESRLIGKINAVDPELAKYNNLLTNLISARDDSALAKEGAGVAFFKKMATQPEDPTVKDKQIKFSRYFDPQNKYRGRKLGLNEAVMSDATFAARAKAIKASIDAEVIPATQDYRLLQKMKSQHASIFHNRFIPYASSFMPKVSGLSGLNKAAAFLGSEGGAGKILSKGVSRGLATRGPSLLGLTSGSSEDMSQPAEEPINLDELGKP